LNVAGYHLFRQALKYENGVWKRMKRNSIGERILEGTTEKKKVRWNAPQGLLSRLFVPVFVP